MGPREVLFFEPLVPCISPTLVVCKEREVFFMKKNKQRKILFILATHGDEGFTIPIFQKIETLYSKSEFGYEWVIGNPKALERNIRYVNLDLNRCAPGKPNSLVYEERRAAELVKYANEFENVIDIHGSISQCGIVTIIPNPTIKNILFAGLLPIKRNVIWNSNSSLNKGSIVQFCKNVAIEIECGPKSSSKIQNKLQSTIIKIITTASETNLNVFEKEFYAVYGKKIDKTTKYKDFVVTQDSEKFIPFMANQYREITCYKMSKINRLTEFLY